MKEKPIISWSEELNSFQITQGKEFAPKNCISENDAIAYWHDTRSAEWTQDAFRKMAEILLK